MKLFVTGGAGFIGSNFIHYMLSKHNDVDILNFDSLTYAGNLENLKPVEKDDRYTFVRGDITSASDVEKVLSSAKYDAIVNFAAESHVDRSIHFGANVFITTNITGTQILLDACRKYNVPRFLQVSTDEVYGSLGNDGKFTENTPLQPNNPYAATKAGADFMVRAAHNSYGLNTVITRCSNNFGPYQFPEKLIPLMIANAMEGKELPVYGDGMHVRDWIFVVDHCSGIDAVLRKAKPGSIYNIGSNHDVPNIEIVKLIIKLLGKSESLIKYVKDRPGHDRRYAMDSTKIQKELAWTPQYSFEDAIKITIDWYIKNQQWWGNIRSGAYKDYYSKLYSNR